MTANIFNIVLLIEFALCGASHFYSGNKAQAIYWTGAFLCTLGVTITEG